jgi:hypothetical protein
MSSHLNFEKLIHKALKEPGFYSQLKSDPEGALKTAGIHPTPAQVAALKSIDYNSIRSVAQAFNGPEDTTFC